jgi:hypothetical protein
MDFVRIRIKSLIRSSPENDCFTDHLGNLLRKQAARIHFTGQIIKRRSALDIIKEVLYGIDAVDLRTWLIQFLLNHYMRHYQT